MPAYCAVALLPALAISPTILFARRGREDAPAVLDENVEPFRRRLHLEEGHKLKARLAEWAASAIGDAINAWPEMPNGIRDRDADVWEALLAVADVAGRNWPERARNCPAARNMDPRSASNPDPSIA